MLLFLINAKMGFTQQKFESLSPLNQKKKTAYSIRQYLSGSESLSYIEALYCWLNGKDSTVPKSKREWEIEQQKLVQDIESSGQCIDSRLFDGEPSQNGNGIIILDNIRAPYNVGGIMRSAEAFSAEKVIMCGITPTSENAKVRRSAMNVPLITEYEAKTADAVIRCRENGYKIIAIEKTSESENISEIAKHLDGKIVMILGNEEFGIDEDIIRLADAVCHIPLSGAKNSLNVCTAAGIAMYVLLGEHK